MPQSRSHQDSEKPKFELGTHELTVAQGTTEMFGTNHGVAVKVEGDHSGVTAMIQPAGILSVTATKDAKEGVAAFLEKRPAIFEGL